MKQLKLMKSLKLTKLSNNLVIFVVLAVILLMIVLKRKERYYVGYFEKDYINWTNSISNKITSTNDENELTRIENLLNDKNSSFFNIYLKIFNSISSDGKCMYRDKYCPDGSYCGIHGYCGTTDEYKKKYLHSNHSKYNNVETTKISDSRKEKLLNEIKMMRSMKTQSVCGFWDINGRYKSTGNCIDKCHGVSAENHHLWNEVSVRMNQTGVPGDYQGDGIHSEGKHIFYKKPHWAKCKGDYDEAQQLYDQALKFINKKPSQKL